MEIALVQPVTRFDPGSFDENVANAQDYVRAAASAGADLVVFPETYPGQWREPIHRVPVDDLKEVARQERVYVVAGFAEPVDDEGRRCYNSLALLGPDGAEVGRYRRTTPNHAPWIYKGSEYWDFDWVPSEELPVFRTDLGCIGLLVCSEIYAPELSRILALKGAEVILSPAGLSGPQYHGGGVGGSLYDTWRILAQARAIENLAYTGLCANLPHSDGLGLCMVSSPEGVVLDAQGEGVHRASLDLERIRWLREQQDGLVDGPAPWGAKPGALRDWRRQAVLDANPELWQGAS